MYTRIVHVGDLPLYFGNSSRSNINLLHFDELLTPEDVDGLIQLALDPGKNVEGVMINGDAEHNFSMLRRNVHFIKAAGGAVFNADGDLLLIRRLGKWDLPKGKFEDKESDEECALREVEEECNVRDLQITDKLTDTYHMYRLNGQWYLKKTIWFRMITGDWQKYKPQTEEDIDEIRWIRLDELEPEKLDTYATIRYVLREL